MVACQFCLSFVITLTRFVIQQARKNQIHSVQPTVAMCKLRCREHPCFDPPRLIFSRRVDRQQQLECHDGHRHRKAQSYAHFLNTTGSLL